MSICGFHARLVYEQVQNVVEQLSGDPELARSMMMKSMLDDSAQRREQRERPLNYCVYYLRVGDLIKIGTTANLRRRLREYPPNSELLAVESGGADVEARRLLQFNEHLVSGTEWFTPAPVLMAHIADLATKVA